MVLTMLKYCLNIFNNLLEAYSLPLGFLSVFASVIMILQLLRLNREYNAIADEEGFNLLHLAAIKGDIETARCLIEKGAEVDAKTTQGKTPLYIAARMKNYNVLELLIQKGANVNELCPNVSALFVAAENGDERLAKILIENNAEINIKTATNGFTPLFWAATSNHQNIANFINKE